MIGEKNIIGRKIDVIFFTDPYCSWCWATDPIILAMEEKYKEQIKFHYVFGGLIKNMDDFYDESNGIRDARAVIPHWRQVSEMIGQPIDEFLWEDIAKLRNFSSFPANIACKSAFLQGNEIGAKFLRNMKIAVFTDRKIISDSKVYNEIAKATKGLDFERFKNDLENQNAEKSFEDDLDFCRKWSVGVFPTMLFYKTGADLDKLTKDTAVYINGYNEIEIYDEIIKKLSEDIKVYEPRDEEILLEVYGPMSERELAQIKNRSKEQEYEILENLYKEGKIEKNPKVRGNIWSIK